MRPLRPRSLSSFFFILLFLHPFPGLSAETPAEAARLHAQTLRRDPSNAPAYEGLGRAMLDLDRPADALSVFRRLDALAPDHPPTLILLATAIARLPNPRRADVRQGLAHADRAAELLPDAPEAWLALSSLRYLDGQYPLAEEAASHALALAALQQLPPETLALYQQQEILCNNARLAFSPLD